MGKQNFLVLGIIKAKSQEEAKEIMRLHFPSFAIVGLRNFNNIKGI
jgi:hypothetical protein